MHRTRYSAPIEPGIVAGGCQALHTGTSKAHAFLSQNNRIADSPLFLTRQPAPRHDGSGYGFSYCWRPAAAAWRLWAWFTGFYWSAYPLQTPRRKWRAANPFSSPFPVACCWQAVGCFSLPYAQSCVRCRPACCVMHAQGRYVAPDTLHAGNPATAAPQTGV